MSGKHMIHGSVMLFFLLLSDQLTKLMAVRFLKYNTVTLIPGVFQLHYLENHGAAFGMFQNMQWIFVVIALVITAALAWLYYQAGNGQRYMLLRLTCILLAAGALGNMIDRICRHCVIDFLYFSLIDFPIFNVADIYVCCGTAIFIYLLLFCYNEQDMDELLGRSCRKNKDDEHRR